jgi:hypothetical protein
MSVDLHWRIAMEQMSFWPTLTREQQIRRKVINDIKRLCLVSSGSIIVVIGLVRFAVLIS